MNKSNIIYIEGYDCQYYVIDYTKQCNTPRNYNNNIIDLFEARIDKCRH